jgi:hypothetical protein
MRAVAATLLACGALVGLGAAPAGSTVPGEVGYMIIAGEGCGLSSVDLATGVVTPIGTQTAQKCVYDLAFTPDGSALYGVRIDPHLPNGPQVATLVQFNVTTGAATDVGQLGTFAVDGPGSSQGNLTFDNSGTMFTYLVPAAAPSSPAACNADDAFCLFSSSPTTPAVATFVNKVAQTFTVYTGLATSCAGTTTSARFGTLTAALPDGWAHTTAPSPQVLTAVNLTATGPATNDIAAISGGSLVGLDYDTSGTLFAVGGDNPGLPSLFTVDQTTGAMTKVATLTNINTGTTIGFGVGALAIAHPCPAPPVPSPPPAAPPIVIAARFTG